MQNNVSEITSTFSYDRLNTGKSSDINKVRSSLDIVKDLEKLIKLSKIEPPFLIVAHSFGCLISRFFTYLNSENIIGMVLIDPAIEYKKDKFINFLDTHLKNKMIKYRDNPELNNEKIDKVETYEEIINNKVKLDIPLTIISRGLPICYGKKWPEKIFLDIETKLYENLKKISDNSKIIIAEKSGHYIHKIQPDIVLNEISKILYEIKKGKNNGS